MIAIIPRPASLEEKSGNFQLTASAKIIAATKGAKQPAKLLAEYLRPATGFALPVGSKASAGDIVLKEDGDDTPDEYGFCRESYKLTVQRDQVTIHGVNATSLVRGIQTLRQMFPAEIYSSAKVKKQWIAPCAVIKDHAQLRWRGIMLDPVRHFFDKKQICRMIELIAQQKMSLVHLHLTDDQGWRMEIKKYPRLTKVGSIRKQTLIGHFNDRPRKYDGKPYGGFFTQDDLREIVAFAAKRHITVVPEIDMPGHMAAAIHAYPELGNFPKNKVEVRDIWGISYQILSPRKSTIEFMQNVLKEVMDIFPSKFIHIGGDEARKDEWEISPEAQQIMAEQGCRNEHELQGYFSMCMQKFLKAHGRRMVGWEEILAPNLDTECAIYNWRSKGREYEAVKHGNPVVMAPCSYTYLDYYQADPEYEPLAIGGNLPLEQVYRFRPVPADMTPKEKKLILGGQGQLWSEYIPTPEHLEYMAFPRSCALAEKLWTEESLCRFADFRKRLSVHFERLNVQKVHAFPLS